MKVKELNWKRKTEETPGGGVFAEQKVKKTTLRAEHKQRVYTIEITVSQADKFWSDAIRVWVTVSAGVNRLYTYYKFGYASQGFDPEEHVKTGKEACKRIALLHVNKTPSVYKEVLKKVPEELHKDFETYAAGVYGAKHLPVVDGPAKSIFLKRALEGEHPRRVAEKLKRKDILDEYLNCLEVETWPARHKVFQKKCTEEAKRNRKQKLLALSSEIEDTKGIALEDPQDDGNVQEQYSGPSPEDRSTANVSRVYTPTQLEPVPFKPKDAKFSTLLKWGEKVRDWFETRQKYATALYLSYAASNCCGFSPERAEKASRRIQLIYAKDLANERRVLHHMITHPTQQEEVKGKKEKKGKDKWGYRLGTNAAKINAVLSKEPKSPKKIAKEAGVPNVHGHLNTLCRKKLARKVENKFRLHKSQQSKG
jgi:hypothetical protein